MRQRGARGNYCDAPLVDCRRATFKYGLGTEFIDVLEALHKGRSRPDGHKVTVGDVRVSRGTWWWPACRTRRRSARRCTAKPVRGCRSRAPVRMVRRGRRTSTASSTTSSPWPSTDTSAWCSEPDRSVAWHSRLLANGTWWLQECWVRGPSSAVPFLDLLKDYGSPWGQRELAP